MLEDLLLSTLRLSVPVLFAAYGGLLSERSGVANIALESYLLVSAFAAAAMVSVSGSLFFGVACGVLAAGFVGALFALTCLWGRGDQIVIGTAFNLLAIGLIPVFTKFLFQSTGGTPALPIELRFTEPIWFFAVAVLTVFVLRFVMSQTRHGLRIWAAGENPLALVNQGVNPRRVRFFAIVEGSLIAGLGGVYLSLCQGSGYTREMAAGRGFIALAALIFGGWRPIPTFLACVFFAFTDAVQIRLQGQSLGGWTIPNHLVQIMPYIVTLIVLVFYSGKMRAPKAINRDI